VTAAPRLTVREVDLRERDVRLRLPFRFGVVTLRECPEAYVRARIALPDGREGWGMAAEMLAPKWFDKDPALSNEDNVAQLRTALRTAADLYMGDRTPRTAFGLFAAHYRDQLAAGAARGLNPLTASYGPALLDRAVLDALCRLERVSFWTAMRANLAGMAPVPILPDLAGFDFGRFLAGLRPLERLQARHTVGLLDPITPRDQTPDTRAGDGLPETLEQVVGTYGHTYFKLKVGGDVDADVRRLAVVASVLDRSPTAYHVTLDGNEQYQDVEGITALWSALQATPMLHRLSRSTLFIEQPITRAAALERDVGVLSARRPVIIDESDDDLDAFVRARARGYRGVSSKSCKGFYKSLVNLARCARWNRDEGVPRYFLSAEDLTTQAGLAVQQDLALVALLGLEHVERNGHHYVNGMAALPASEQAAFLRAHPDLYADRAGAVRLRIVGGALATGSLGGPGWGSAAEPEWTTLRPMPPSR
jgi:hypothetical protein